RRQPSPERNHGLGEARRIRRDLPKGSCVTTRVASLEERLPAGPRSGPRGDERRGGAGGGAGARAGGGGDKGGGGPAHRGAGRAQWPLTRGHRRDERDNRGGWAIGTDQRGLNRAQITCDQEHDVVEVGVVVESAAPRLVGWAGMRGGGERHDGRDEAETQEPGQ